MANTVLELKELLKVKLHGYKYSFSGGEGDLLKILNSAQHTLWLLLISAGRANGGGGNWFIKEGTITLNGSRDVDLPEGFHDLAFVESTTSGWQDVQFKASDWYKQVFQEHRRIAGTAPATEKTRFFVVSGGRPARFSLDRIPAASIDLHIFYTYFFTDFVDDDTDITYIPPPYRDALVNYACAQLIGSDQDAAIKEIWSGFWNEHKAFVSAIAGTRQIADVVGPQAYDRSG